MFSIIGDFVRNGDTVKDSVHSVVVQDHRHGNVGLVFSMNRCGRTLYMHVWQADDNGDITPIGSTPYDALKAEYMKWERSGALGL